MPRSSPCIAVLGSSRAQPGDPVYAQALALGRALAEAGFAVCNGGYGGIMEAVSRGAGAAGGHVVGVTCSVYGLAPNPWIAEERAHPTWIERMFALLEAGDAYIFLPGGTGTLVELAAAWEMLNKRLTRSRPAIVLGEFWTPILDTVRRLETNDGSRWEEAKAPLLRRAPDVPTAMAFLAAELPRSAGI